MERYQSTVLRAFGAIPDSMPTTPPTPPPAYPAYQPPGLPPTSAATTPTPVYPAYPPRFPPTAAGYPPPGFFCYIPAPFFAPPAVAPPDVAPATPATRLDVAPATPATRLDVAPVATTRPPPKTYGVTTARLLHQGYSYSIKSRHEKHDRIYWRCTVARAEKCRATCTSDFARTPDSVKLGQPHTCRPPATPEEMTATQTKVQTMHNLKIHAIQCNDAPSAITSDVYGPCSNDVLGMLPLRVTAMRLVRKERPTWIAPKDIHFAVSFLFLFLVFFFSKIKYLDHNPVNCTKLSTRYMKIKEKRTRYH